MEINELTGTGERLKPPDLTEEKKQEILALCQKAGHSANIEYEGREYWAEGDWEKPQYLWVVAWKGKNPKGTFEAGETFYSGDPIIHPGFV